MNPPVKIPPETEQVWDATTLPDIEQVVSLVEKPEPETSTVNPTEPEVGLREIDGTLRVDVELTRVEVELVVVEEVDDVVV